MKSLSPAELYRKAQRIALWVAWPAFLMVLVGYARDAGGPWLLGTLGLWIAAGLMVRMTLGMFF